MMKNERWRILAAVGVLLAGAATGRADVRLPEVISNNMVLQKDIPLPIWGWAAAGEEVTVTLGNSTVKGTADGAGKWKVVLPAVKTAGGPHEMIVKGKNEIKVSNILIGHTITGPFGRGSATLHASCCSSQDSMNLPSNFEIR